MLLLGNIVSFFGCIVMVAVGFIKNKDKIMKVQCLQFGLMGLGNLILGAMGGFVSNGVSIIRNLAFTRIGATPRMKVGFIVVQAVLTLIVGGTALIEWLPIIGMVVFVWCLDMKSAVGFKCVMMFGQSLWVIYDWYYMNYSAFAFDILTLITTVVGIVMILREKKKR